MRALGMLAIAALLASCLETLRRLAVPMWAGTGFAVALSPMVLFLAGDGEPERRRDRRGHRGLGARRRARDATPQTVDARVVDRLGDRGGRPRALARALAALARRSSGSCCILLTTRARARRMVGTRRRVWIWGGVLGACARVPAWWYVYGEPARALRRDTGARAVSRLWCRTSIGKSRQMLREMVGVFGWLDTRRPGHHVLRLGARARRARRRSPSPSRRLAFVWAILAATVATLVLPVIVEVGGSRRGRLHLAGSLHAAARGRRAAARRHRARRRPKPWQRRAPPARGSRRQPRRRAGRRVRAGLAPVLGRRERVAVVLLRRPVGTAGPRVALHRAVRIARWPSCSGGSSSPLGPRQARGRRTHSAAT